MCLFPSFTIWAHVGLILLLAPYPYSIGSFATSPLVILRAHRKGICPHHCYDKVFLFLCFHTVSCDTGSSSPSVLYGHERHVAVNFTISLRMTTWHNAKLNVSHRYHNVSNVSYLDINVLDRNIM